jgi:hypothetical protein
METTEKIVEAYVRHVKRWATIPNVRCDGQFEIDLLAIDPVTLERYHIETSVSGSHYAVGTPAIELGLTANAPEEQFPAEVCERMRRDGGSVFPTHANTGDPDGPEFTDRICGAIDCGSPTSRPTRPSADHAKLHSPIRSALSAFEWMPPELKADYPRLSKIRSGVIASR